MTSMLATLLLATSLTSGSLTSGAPELTSTEVSFRGDGGISLHGTVLSPTGGGPPRAGVVLVHGAGEGTPRAKLMGEATAFARQGLAVLVYDKRSVDYSLFKRSYLQLSTDALAAVATLRASKGVDPAKVGLLGLSEGGWVAPLAASRSADVAFLITVGANSLEPLRQQSWAVTAGLRKAGVSGSLVERAQPTLYRAVADGGLFPEAYYQPLPVLRKVRQPVLGIWGDRDLLTPPRESPPLFAQGLEQGGNRHYRLHYFPGADHAAHQSPDGGVTRLPALAPGYAELVGSWVSDVTSGKLPDAVQPATLPEQASTSLPVPPPAWWESAPVQLGALVLLLVAFAAYPLTALARRLRRRSPASPGGAPRLVSAAGLVAVLGGFGYLIQVMMSGAKLASPGPLLAGRPLPWLALQALAVAVVVATAATVPLWRRSTGAERVRLSVLLTGGAVFLPWALYWGLLLP